MKARTTAVGAPKPIILRNFAHAELGVNGIRGRDLR
jgi:hypothetical protein